MHVPKFNMKHLIVASSLHVYPHTPAACPPGCMPAHGSSVCPGSVEQKTIF